jgi:hypothetical protein
MMQTLNVRNETII